jgi:RNA polymerase-binding transcription factor DksA
MSSDVNTEKASVDYRNLLENEHRELAARLKELGVGGEELYFDTNFADSSQVTAERGELDRLIRELQEALEMVEKALAKLDEGTYGKCELCHGDIDPVRLEAKPAVLYCINCASKK